MTVTSPALMAYLLFTVLFLSIVRCGPFARQWRLLGRQGRPLDDITHAAGGRQALPTVSVCVQYSTEGEEHAQPRRTGTARATRGCVVVDSRGSAVNHSSGSRPLLAAHD